MTEAMLPVKTYKSCKCHRCTMRYKEKLGYCPHCKDVPDGEPLQRHIRKHQERLHANKNLGVLFLVMALAFSVLLAVAFM